MRNAAYSQGFTFRMSTTSWLYSGWRILAIALVTISPAPALLAQPAPDESAVKLRALGAKRLSPVAQSVVGAEAVDTRSLAVDTETMGEAAKRLERKFEAWRKGEQPKGIDATAKRTAVSAMAKSLEQAQHDYEKKRTEIEGAYSMGEGARALIDIAPGGGASQSFFVRAAAKILTAGSNRVSSEDMKTELAKAKTEYDAQVTATVTLALAQTSNATRDKWIAQRNGLTEAGATVALREILGPNQEFFQQDLTNNMSAEAREAITSAKVDILKRSLGAVAAKNDEQLKQIRATITNGFADTNKRIDGLAKGFKQFDVQLRSNTDALEQLSRQSEAEFKLLSQGMVGIQSQVGAMQAAMWRNMTPGEQVQALDDGFLPGVKDDTRAKLRTTLARTADILARRDDAISKLGTISTVGHFATSIGLPIDTYNMDRNIQVASAAVNVVASVASGNYFGALTQAGGLFPGSGGPDPMEAVNQKLDKIITLQYKILEEIENLSRQVAASTITLMNTLNSIEVKVDLLVEAQLDTFQRNGPQACRRFIEYASDAPFKMESGLFPTYALRRKHFEAMRTNGYQYFETCTRYLDLASSLKSNIGDAGNAYSGPYLSDGVLLAKHNDKAPTATESYQARFTRLRQYSDAVLDVASPAKPQCANRYLARLSVAPGRWSVVGANPSCAGEPKDIAAGPVLTLHDGRPIRVADALADALAPGAVRELGEYLLFFGTYKELLKEPQLGQRVMLTESELLTGNAPGWIESPEVERWPKGYLDVVNLALAQQTLLAGVYLSQPTSKLLIDSEFGKKAVYPPDPEKVDDPGQKQAYIQLRDQCRVESVALKEYPYVLATCLMAHEGFEAFRANVIHYMVKTKLLESGATVPEYAWALRSGDRALIARTLPTLPLVREVVEGRLEWAVELKDHLNQRWLIPLPTASEIRSDQVDYSTSGELLRELRQRLMERLILVTEWKKIEQESAQKFYLRQAVLNDPSIARVQFLNAPSGPPH